MKILILALVFCFPAMAQAKTEVVKFPQEELARETVLPIFDNAPVVKHRNIVTKGRIELGGGAGLMLTEPLYQPTNFYVTGSYHFSETHGMNLTGVFFTQGLSNKGQELKAGTGLLGAHFDASLAPQLKWMILPDYQLTAFYGKISLTKQTVINLSLYFLGGIDVASYGDSTDYGINVGFGEKFYFTKNVALRADLRLLAYQGPDPTSDKDGLDPSKNDQKRSSADLDKTIFYQTLLGVGLVYLF